MAPCGQESGRRLAAADRLPGWSGTNRGIAMMDLIVTMHAALVDYCRSIGVAGPDTPVIHEEEGDQ